MARCSGFKPDGTPCERIVPASQRYCYSHDPDRKKERKRNAARGGKTRGRSEIKELRELLEDLTTRVVDGKLETSRGAVAAQLINTRIRLAEFERKILEQDELLDRIERLEEAYTRAGNTTLRRHQWGG